MNSYKRIFELTKKIKEEELDAFIVSKPENIFYLTSFFSDSMMLVITQKKRFAVTDFRYAEAAGNAMRGFELIVFDGKLSDFPKTIAAVLGKKNAERVGFESSSLTFLQYKNLKSALKNKALIPCSDTVESLREIKSADEVSLIRQALILTKETFKEIGNILRPDITESQAARRIKELFIRNGAFGTAFEPIVATQPGASQPHYRTRDKKLGKDKFILIDMGAIYKGYNSDLTRVLPLGKIRPRFKMLYAILIEAQERAINIIRPGAKISDVDNAARQYIASRGFGRFFGHSLGHGIGLEVHERPSISPRNAGLLREGMVFTIEPGIYIPGYGGLRLEDTVLVTKKGCRNLTYDIDK